ncbi:MAG: hypothetical protein RL081_1613 [Pseudomonadota bacterium]|jgi:hypothetical protein
MALPFLKQAKQTIATFPLEDALVSETSKKRLRRLFHRLNEEYRLPARCDRLTSGCQVIGT